MRHGHCDNVKHTDVCGGVAAQHRAHYNVGVPGNQRQMLQRRALTVLEMRKNGRQSEGARTCWRLQVQTTERARQAAIA